MRPRGLTTAETIVAIGFLAVALLAMVGLFTSAFKSINQTNELTIGTEVAREMLENIKVLTREAPPPVDQTYDGALPTPQEDNGFPPGPYPSVERDGTVYTVIVTVAPAPDTTRAKVVTVEVTWKDGGRTQLQTYL